MDMQLLKQLREETGASFTLCKEALEKSKGDKVKAVEYIQEKSKDKILKKAERQTKVGIIDVYAHGQERKIGAMVEVSCETDFVARTPEFRTFAHEVALQIAAMNPQYVSREEIPENVLQEQKEELAKDETLAKKPKEMQEKIITGKLEKYFKDVCLVEQLYFRDQDVTMKQLLEQSIVKFGENVKIVRFIRWHL